MAILEKTTFHLFRRRSKAIQKEGSSQHPHAGISTDVFYLKKTILTVEFEGLMSGFSSKVG